MRPRPRRRTPTRRSRRRRRVTRPRVPPGRRPGSRCGAAARAARRGRWLRPRGRGRTRRASRPGDPCGSAAPGRRRARRRRGSTPCTAREAPSRSRASRPCGARRTPALLPSPRHDPAAEAEAPRTDVVDPGRAPCLLEAALRPRCVEAADRAAEERADLAPAVAGHRARDRQPGPDIELPERPPDAARDGELEACDRAARTHDPRKLAERRSGVGDVAQQIGEGERVELAVDERELVGTCLDELGATVRAPPSFGEHPRALVDADHHAAVPRGQRAGDEPGSSRDVENPALRAGRDPRHEEAPPPRILAEGEDRSIAFVRGTDRGEERLGVHRRQSRLLEMNLDELAHAAGAHGEVSGVLAAESAGGEAAYLVSYGEDDAREWLLLDGRARPGPDRARVREGAALVAMCGGAAELAGADDEARVAPPAHLHEGGAADPGA